MKENKKDKKNIFVSRLFHIEAELFVIEKLIIVKLTYLEIYLAMTLVL